MPERRPPLSLRVEAVTQEANAVLLSVLAAGATWFAPLPEAVMTAQAIRQIFGLPAGIAACVAASLELIGVSANAALNDAREFNARAWRGASGKRLQNPRYPLESESRPRNLLVGFYVTTAGIVVATAVYNVAIEGAPLIRLLACLFPIASGIGAMVANSRASLRRRMASINAEETQSAKDAAQTAESETHSALPAVVIAPIAAHGNNGNGNGSHNAPHVCEHCGAEFAKPQSLSAHLRFCEAYQAQKIAV